MLEQLQAGTVANLEKSIRLKAQRLKTSRKQVVRLTQICRSEIRKAKTHDISTLVRPSVQGATITLMLTSFE